ncbi:VOC family protein [Streptomyces sp. NPDC050121]|uniref:VOC family protein n=1 Tax=Streptomyces sp. NPDC050121 TaxID=3365601 RepID=UPI00378E0C82
MGSSCPCRAVTHCANSRTFAVVQRTGEPKPVKERMHFDITSTNPPAEQQRVEALGGYRLEECNAGGSRGWRTTKAMSGVQREVAGRGSGVRGLRSARAGCGRMTSVKKVGQRSTSQFVRSARACFESSVSRPPRRDTAIC